MQSTGIYTAMSLTDTAIKNAKPTADKAYKLQDEKGMFLLVNPNGAVLVKSNLTLLKETVQSQ